MNNYVDLLGRYHDKPIKPDQLFSSNNAWTYTATALLLRLPLDRLQLRVAFARCLNGTISFHRHPGVTLPPLSRDEVQGALILGLYSTATLINNNYYFCNLGYPKPAPLLDQLKTLWRVRKMHRNSIWNEPTIWKWSFTLPIQDQYWVDVLEYGRAPIWKTIWFYTSSILTIRKKDPSGCHVLWQKLTHLKQVKKDSILTRLLLRFLKAPDVLKNYFRPDHPFNNLLPKK